MRLALHIWLSLVLFTPVLAAADDSASLPAPPTAEGHEIPAAPPVAEGGRFDATQLGGVPFRIERSLFHAFGQVPAKETILQMAELANAATKNGLTSEMDQLGRAVVDAYYGALKPRIQQGLGEFKDSIPAQAANLAAMVGLVPACWLDSKDVTDANQNPPLKSIEQVQGQAVLRFRLDANGYPYSPAAKCEGEAPTEGEKALFALIAKHIQAVQPAGQPVQNFNDAPGNPGLPQGQDIAQGPLGPEDPNAQPGQPGDGKGPGEGGSGGGGSGGGGSGSGSGAGAGGGGSGGGAQYQSKAEKTEAMKVEQPQPTQPVNFQGLSVPEATLNEQMLAQMQIPQQDPEKVDARKAQMDGFIEELTKMRTQAIQAAIQLSQAYQNNLQGPVQSGSQLQLSNVNPMFGNYAERIRALGGTGTMRTQGYPPSSNVGSTGRSRTMPSAMGSGMLATTPTPRRVYQTGSATTARRGYLPVRKMSR